MFVGIHVSNYIYSNEYFIIILLHCFCMVMHFLMCGQIYYGIQKHPFESLHDQWIIIVSAA